MNDFARHGFQHRSGCLERVSATADHERQCARDRTLDPAGDRSIELGEAAFGGVGVHAARIVHGDCRTVDKQGALGGGWHDVGVTLLHEGAVRQHGDDDIGTLHRGCGSVEDRDPRVGSRLTGGGHRIEAPNGMSCGNQVGRHRATHIAQAQECDRGHLFCSVIVVMLRRAPGRTPPVRSPLA